MCLKGIGNVHNAEFVVFEFRLKLFCPKYISVGDIKPFDANPYSRHDVGREGMFVNSMAVNNCIPIEEYVPVDSLSIQRSEDVDAGFFSIVKDANVRISSWPVHVQSKVLR